MGKEVTNYSVLEERIAYAFEKIEKLEETTSNIEKMNYNIEGMLNEMKTMNQRISDIEKAPLKEYQATKRKIKDTIITAIFTFIVTSLLTVFVYYVKLGVI